MKRRDFIQRSQLMVAGSFLPLTSCNTGESVSQEAIQHPHQPPKIKNRLTQGSFSTYGQHATAPENYLVMVTSPMLKSVTNVGKGMVTYLCDEVGPPNVSDQKLYDSMESLAKWPIGDKLYIRVDWRDLQKKPGKLEFPDHWKIGFELAAKFNKRVGLRVQLMSPVIEGHSMPDFLIDKVPMYKLGKTDEIGIPGKVHYAPRYDHPNFIAAIEEFDGLLANEYNGHPLVEYIDTYMYGFWGEGHTWPFDGNPFPNFKVGEKTFLDLFEIQNSNWNKTPLTTNTQPDYSFVGNDALLDRTLASSNWLRTDTIFIETDQINTLSNRPPWVGATIEQGFSSGQPNKMKFIDGVPKTEVLISHIKDVGPTHCSLWNWHNLSANNLERYYNQYPSGLDDLANNIGYKVRPSWIWLYEKSEHPFLILGLVNDGIAGVPGALYIYIESPDHSFKIGGTVDPGFPVPGKVHQVELKLPKGVAWEGLKLKANIEVKGVQYPLKWSCLQATDENECIVLRENLV